MFTLSLLPKNLRRSLPAIGVNSMVRYTVLLDLVNTNDLQGFDAVKLSSKVL